MFNSASKIFVACVAFALTTASPVVSKGKEKDPEAYKPKAGSSIYLDKENARIMFMQAKNALRANNYDSAIKLGRQAVECDPEDMDARVVFGEALFAKYLNERDRENPGLFNECVKTWLVVHRNVVGEEAASYKGISIPLANNLFADEERGMLAKQRLITLCGRPPKFWETNKKYLKKVLIPETQVAGEIVAGDQKDKQR